MTTCSQCSATAKKGSSPRRNNRATRSVSFLARRIVSRLGQADPTPVLVFAEEKRGESQMQGPRVLVELHGDRVHPSILARVGPIARSCHSSG